MRPFQGMPVHNNYCLFLSICITPLILFITLAANVLFTLYIAKVTFISTVLMYRCESWTIKNAECQRTDTFKLWCWRRYLRVPWVWVNSGSWWWTGRPGVLRFMGSQRVGYDWATDLIWSDLDSKEVKPVNPKGNQPWIFIGRTDAEAEASILWPPVKSWLTGKDPDAGKDRGQEKKGGKRGWDGWMASLTGWTWVGKFWETLTGREAWHAAVHGVKKSRTQLSNWKTTTLDGNFL